MIDSILCLYVLEYHTTQHLFRQINYWSQTNCTHAPSCLDRLATVQFSQC